MTSLITIDKATKLIQKDIKELEQLNKRSGITSHCHECRKQYNPTYYQLKYSSTNWCSDTCCKKALGDDEKALRMMRVAVENFHNAADSYIESAQDLLDTFDVERDRELENHPNLDDTPADPYEFASDDPLEREF